MNKIDEALQRLVKVTSSNDDQELILDAVLEYEQLQAEQQAYNALREKLKTIEFLPDYVLGNDYDLCEICKSYRKDGHATDCWLAQAIKEDSK